LHSAVVVATQEVTSLPSTLNTINEEMQAKDELSAFIFTQIL